jgi:ATP-dependent RNA helicase DDX19/DBP5
MSLASRMGPIPGDKPASTSWADDAEEEFSAQPAAAEAQPAEPEQATNLDEPSYEVNVKLADQQGDPNSPLYSVKRFEDLGLYGYCSPTPLLHV